jgi:hypothetical protein
MHLGSLFESEFIRFSFLPALNYVQFITGRCSFVFALFSWIILMGSGFNLWFTRTSKGHCEICVIKKCLDRRSFISNRSKLRVLLKTMKLSGERFSKPQSLLNSAAGHQSSFPSLESSVRSCRGRLFWMSRQPEEFEEISLGRVFLARAYRSLRSSNWFQLKRRDVNTILSS